MKLEIGRLGPLKDTSLEWNEGLTLLIGPNQTGESYLAMVLDYLLRLRGKTFSIYPEFVYYEHNYEILSEK